MKKVTPYEAERNFDALLDAVESGEEIIITRNGKEAGRLMPLMKKKIKLISTLEKRCPGD